MDRRLLCAGGTLALISAALLAGCGGDGSDPTPPGTDGQTVTITVATSGEDVDADGYTVALGGRSAAVGSSGSVSFEDVDPGTYEVRLTGVVDNCEVTGGDTRDVMVTSTGATQVAFAVICSEDPDGGFTTVSCPGVAPAAGEALPLEILSVGHLPATLEGEPWARITAQDHESSIPAFLEPGPDGDHRLFVPVSPDGDPSGATVIVRITDGERACAPFELTIAELAPAPGELGRVVDGLEALLATQAVLMDVDLGTLASTPMEEMEPYLLPIALIQRVVDHPDNPNSLRAFADGTAPYGQGVDRTLLEALLARTGFASMLEGVVAPAAPTGALEHAAVGSALNCLVEPITDGEHMSDCMNLAFSAALQMREEGAGKQVMGDIGKILGGVGVIPIPPAKLAAAVAGIALWVSQVYTEGVANLLPSTFVAIHAPLAPPSFEEDQAATGAWGPAKVTSASRGWKLDKLVFDAIMQVIGAHGAYQDWMNRFLPALPDDVVSGVRGLILAAGIETAINLTEGSDFVEIESRTFGPADVTSQDLSEAEIISGSSISLNHTAYTPVGVGVTRFIVRTKPDGSLFANQSIATDPPLEVEVEQLSLHLDPDDVFVEPEEVISLGLTVSKSAHPEMVERDPSVQLQGMAEHAYFGNDTHLVRYHAPADPDFDTPDQLTYRHTATTGARAHSNPERVATATIRFGDLEITPRGGCLSPNDTLSFAAEVKGPEGVPVVWEADEGSIDAAGFYRAPSTVPAGGTATIRAHAEPHPDLDDEVTIQIGGCTCSWSVTLNGELFEGQPGDTASFHELVPGGAYDRLVQIRLIGAGGQFVMIGPEPPGTIVIGPTAFQGQVAGNIGTSVAPPYSAYSTRYPGPYVGDQPEWAETDVILSRYDSATAVVGAASGRVALHGNEVNIDEAPRVPFEATFQITLPADYSEVLRFYRTFQCEVPPDGTP